MAAPPNNNFNPAGRPKGSVNETSKRVREAFASLLEGREQELADALSKVRDKDPKSFIELWIKVSERFVPTLSRQELTGAEGEPFQPIQIILPTNPKKDE